MELKPYSTALNALKLDKSIKVNYGVKLPQDMGFEVKGNDFINLFLPYLTICVDSREQDTWVQDACGYFGIKYELAVKDKKAQTENLKEGDITFKVTFGNKEYNYTNIAHYERKGCASEFCNNVMADRQRIEAEFERQLAKGYRKFVLVLEFGDKPTDLIDYEFSYYAKGGNLITKSCGQTVYATVCSWIQPNKYALDLIMCDTQFGSKLMRSRARSKLLWLILYDMYYFFRQEIRLEAARVTEV